MGTGAICAKAHAPIMYKCLLLLAIGQLSETRPSRRNNCYWVFAAHGLQREKHLDHQPACVQGDQMSLRKNRPKCSPIHFFCQKLYIIYTLVKISPTFWATSVIFEKTLKVNKRPLVENSPNLVTLPACLFLFRLLQFVVGITFCGRCYR
jgi:hypothetical protein